MINPEQIQALKDKYPGVILDLIENEVVAPGVSFVVRRPNDNEWRRYRGMQANDEQAPSANRTLVLGQIVQPTPEDFMRMLDTQPGLIETLAIAIRTSAGASNASSVRKL